MTWIDTAYLYLASLVTLLLYIPRKCTGEIWNSWHSQSVMCLSESGVGKHTPRARANYTERKSSPAAAGRMNLRRLRFLPADWVADEWRFSCILKRRTLPNQVIRPIMMWEWVSEWVRERRKHTLVTRALIFLLLEHPRAVSQTAGQAGGLIWSRTVRARGDLRLWNCSISSIFALWEPVHVNYGQLAIYCTAANFWKESDERARRSWKANFQTQRRSFNRRYRDTDFIQ